MHVKMLCNNTTLWNKTGKRWKKSTKFLFFAVFITYYIYNTVYDDYCEKSTDHRLGNHVEKKERFDKSNGRYRRLLLWMMAEGEAEPWRSAWQRWRGGGNCTCLGGRKPHTPLSVQQGERDVQLIIQAAPRHSAWVALSWWADRGKPRMPFEQKEGKREEETRKRRDECLWSWSVIPRLLLSAFLGCTWNVARCFCAKP